ncbi:hypothetical protein Plhal304r1_c008g0031411 [Plasmopara halstedii]
MDRPTEYLILAPEIHRDVQSRLTSRRNRDETAYDECHPSLMLLNAQVLAYHCVKREMGRRVHQSFIRYLKPNIGTIVLASLSFTI